MKLSNTLLQLFILLDSQSDNNYLVGGCVRDWLLGVSQKDYDVVTDVSMDTIDELFSQNGWKVNSVGKQFLVIIVSKNDEQFDIANFRKDGNYSDGRRPESVDIGTLEEDAARRDFTVNSIYYNPLKYKFVDPNGGREDLENKILKFIGKPKDRIKEDYLRIFRFYRFLNKGLKPDKNSLKACRTLFNEAYTKITPERVRSEVERMIKL